MCGPNTIKVFVFRQKSGGRRWALTSPVKFVATNVCKLFSPTWLGAHFLFYFYIFISVMAPVTGGWVPLQKMKTNGDIRARQGWSEGLLYFSVAQFYFQSKKK